MVSVNIFNDKGNVSPLVRAEIKSKALARLTDTLAVGFSGSVVTGADGAVYVHIYDAETGAPIYLRLEATVSLKDPSTPVNKTARVSEPKAAPVIPDLE